MLVHSRNAKNGTRDLARSKKIRFYVWSEQKSRLLCNRVFHTHVSYTPLLPGVSPTPFKTIQPAPQHAFRYSDQRPLLESRRHPRCRPFQIYILNPRFPLTGLSYQVPKILSRDLTLPFHLDPLLPLLSQLLDRLLQAGTQAFGGVPQDFADFGGDAGGVGMGVVEGGEGGGDAAGEAGRQGVRNGVQGVSCC